ncbi:transposase, partial [Streptococcus pneumoniae]|nr:transposase [Streptococcus pneumoniae]
MCVPPERKKRKAINPDPQVQAMRDKMSTDAGRAARRLRSAIIEPPFGHLKLGLGFTRFLYRGLVGVTTEWTLVT